jgi:hypothetical protein
VSFSSLTLVEAAVAFAIGGSVLAAAIPAFVRDLQASRLAEPVEGLKRIGESAVALAESVGTPSTAFPASAPLTPADVARGVRAEDPRGAWEHPTWKALGFGFDHPHAFSFAFDVVSGATESRFRASAHGDLDGDGVTSTFEIEGKADATGVMLLPGMYVDREVE